MSLCLSLAADFFAKRAELSSKSIECQHIKPQFHHRQSVHQCVINKYRFLSFVVVSHYQQQSAKSRNNKRGHSKDSEALVQRRLLPMLLSMCL